MRSCRKKICDLRIEIYTNDHNPPHFHVNSKNHEVYCKLLIKDCSIIEGVLSSKNLKKIKKWMKEDGRQQLNETWKNYHGNK